MTETNFDIQVSCHKCGGSGMIVDSVPIGGGQSQIVQTECQTCGGTGIIVSGTIALAEIVDKLDDVFDKCNDIKEVVDEIKKAIDSL